MIPTTKTSGIGLTTVIWRAAVLCSSLLAIESFAQSDYVSPKTLYGYPDLQGVWNYASNTPLQRPEEFGEKEFLTPAEVAQLKAEREAAMNNRKFSAPHTSRQSRPTAQRHADSR